jgi:hypothetical protein
VSFNEYEAFSKRHEKGFTYLLSFPRSGNTWTRYALEFLTGRPSGEIGELLSAELRGEYHNMNSPHGLKFHFPLDFGKGPLVKVHHLKEPWMVQRKDLKLLLVVRNYRECMISHGRGMAGVKGYIRPWGGQYIDNLRLFDGWDEKLRLLVYYEDLRNHPEQELGRIITFLEDDIGGRMGEFMANYKAHKRACLDLYEKDAKISPSKGDSDTYYSDQLQQIQIDQINRFIEGVDPFIFQKYLLRYKVI